MDWMERLLLAVRGSLLSFPSFPLVSFLPFVLVLVRLGSVW